MTENLSDYSRKIEAIHEELGIPPDYATSCGMPLHPECINLVDTETDVFGRQPRMDARAYQAWREMKAAAGQAGIVLEIISAYRDADYQKKIFLNKLAVGQPLEEILKVNAAPGYSEHHSGMALDIGCPGYEHLAREFEQSPAFSWLIQHAGDFGFSLSFGEDNPFGVLYEPWHWKFSA